MAKINDPISIGTGYSSTVRKVVDILAVPQNAEAVNISTTDYIPSNAGVAVKLFITGTGNVKVDMAGGIGTGITFTGIAANTFLNVLVSKVYKTGTSATSIIAMW